MGKSTRDNRTPDGRHPMFGESESLPPMPGFFNVPDEAATCSQYFGRMMTPSDGDVGIDREEYNSEYSEND